MRAVEAAAGSFPVAPGAKRVKLLPIGSIDMRDGRGPYQVRDQAHAQRIVDATRAWLGGAELMFDYDHQALHAPKAGVGGTAIAAGWGDPASLTAELDGIYITATWTPAATAKLATREYRYVSPTFIAAQGSGDVIQLKNAALVNIGAIDLPAIAAGLSHETEEVAAMIVSAPVMKALSINFVASFTDAFKGVSPLWPQVAMRANSTTGRGLYGWLGQLPFLREWTGDKLIKSVETFGFEIINKPFEATIEVRKHDIADDNAGMYVPLFTSLGEVAAQHPDELVFEAMRLGFTAPCYDNQNFFDVAHPSFNAKGEATVASNMQAGTDEPWYLLDTSSAIKPFIFQERERAHVWAVTDPFDSEVAKSGKFTWFCEARGAAGYGLWQKAFASKLPLNGQNYEAAKATMTALRGDSGRLLGVKPTVCVVPPSLETAAKQLFNKTNLTGGEGNIHFQELPIIVVPWLAN